MKIELRTVRYVAQMSDETACFWAKVFIDGKDCGSVENDGHGGCHRYGSRETERRLNAYAETLPKTDIKLDDEDGKPIMVQPDADMVIGEALDAFLLTRDLTRLLKTKLVFAKGGKILTTKKLTPPTIALFLRDPEKTRAKYGADTLLNAIPFAEALDLYRASAA